MPSSKLIEISNDIWLLFLVKGAIEFCFEVVGKCSSFELIEFCFIRVVLI